MGAQRRVRRSFSNVEEQDRRAAAVSAALFAMTPAVSIGNAYLSRAPWTVQALGNAAVVKATLDQRSAAFAPEVVLARANTTPCVSDLHPSSCSDMSSL